jgi:hypothetical protein
MPNRSRARNFGSFATKFDQPPSPLLCEFPMILADLLDEQLASNVKRAYCPRTAN